MVQRPAILSRTSYKTMGLTNPTIQYSIYPTKPGWKIVKRTNTRNCIQKRNHYETHRCGFLFFQCKSRHQLHECRGPRSIEFYKFKSVYKSLGIIPHPCFAGQLGTLILLVFCSSMAFSMLNLFCGLNPCAPRSIKKHEHLKATKRDQA